MRTKIERIKNLWQLADERHTDPDVLIKSSEMKLARELVAELNKAIGPHVDNWREGLISTVELIDMIRLVAET